jgi:hypothetical protein
MDVKSLYSTGIFRVGSSDDYGFDFSVEAVATSPDYLMIEKAQRVE